MSDEPDLDTTSLLDADDAENQIETDDEIEGRDAEGDTGDEAGQSRSQDGGARQDAQERSERVARQPASETIRSLRSERQRAEQALRDATLRAEALERQIAAQNQRPDPAYLARQAQEEAERVSMMAPHEVAQYYASKTQYQLQQQIQFNQRQQMEALDRINFRATVAMDPLARRFEADVEAKVAEQAAKGLTVSREDALNWAAGKALRAKAAAAAKTQKVAGAARVAAQTTRRGTAAGDVQNDAAARGMNSKAALEKRLAGQNI